MKNTYWIWLSIIPCVGPIMQKKLLNQFGTPKAVYEASEEELQKLKGISSRAIQSILQNHSLEKAKRIYDQCQNRQICMLTIQEQNYSEIAKTCPESPILLYYKGKLKEHQNAVAVIGSRRCSDYGKKITAQIVANLSKHDAAIISGMAKGIDSYAHTAALKNNVYTIAFLASGVDICYPKEHQLLYKKLEEHGAILSKYPPGTKPYSKYFLERNALISAWSNHVIIVEAGKKSGALTTAQFAYKYNRKVFSVPNRIDVPEAIGSNLLLKSLAAPYLGVNSLNLLDKSSDSSEQTLISTKKSQKAYKDKFFTKEELRVIELLKSGPKQVKELVQMMELTTVNDMDELLLNLELKGCVKILGEFVFNNSKVHQSNL